MEDLLFDPSFNGLPVQGAAMNFLFSPSGQGTFRFNKIYCEGGGAEGDGPWCDFNKRNFLWNVKFE